MSYPRNAASPPIICVGAVVLISDGTVQTSGVSIAVRQNGGSETAGGGTTSYGGSSGLVYYVPTQAETNTPSFTVAAYKTGCIPVAQTIITSASAVSGYAGLDWATINAPTTTQGLTGTTISSSQIVASVSGAVGSVTGAVGSVTGNVGGNVTGSVGSVVGAVGSVTGNVGGNVVGTVASVVGAVGSVTGNVGGNVTGTVASIVSPGNIWDVTLASHLTAGSTGFALNAAGSAGDLWGTALPGAYGAGTAGFILGTNLDATISSRAPSSTALSTVQWTNTLATNIGTTNSTVATNLNTTISSRAAAATALSTAQWTNALATDLGTTNTTVASNLNATITSRQATFTSDTGITFPTNFSVLGITAAGKINEVVLVDTLTTYTGNTPQTGDSFARIGATGSGLTSLAPAATALSTANWPTLLATNLTTLASHDPGSTLAAASAVAAVNAQGVKVLAAVYDTNTSNGTNVLTLSNGATLTFNLTTGARTQA